MSQSPAMRRAPQRVRGQQRVDRLLDAAEAVFAEVGYEAATTNQIAARATTSIGSLYQFFPNKEAILEAVAARYRAGFAAVCDDLLPPGGPMASLPIAAERLIDAMVAFGLAHLGFTRLMKETPPHSPIAAAVRPIHNDLLARLDALLAAESPQLSPDQRRRSAVVALTAVSGVLALAIGEKEAGHDEAAQQMVVQAKRLLSAYLTSLVDA